MNSNHTRFAWSTPGMWPHLPRAVPSDDRRPLTRPHAPGVVARASPPRTPRNPGEPLRPSLVPYHVAEYDVRAAPNAGSVTFAIVAVRHFCEIRTVVCYALLPSGRVPRPHTPFSAFAVTVLTVVHLAAGIYRCRESRFRERRLTRG